MCVGVLACVGLVASLPGLGLAQSAQQAAANQGADSPTLHQRSADVGSSSWKNAQLPVVATGHTSLPTEAEGAYPYDHAGDTVEIYFDGGLLHGYMTEADPNDQHAAPVTYDFATTHADGSAVEWTTRRVHDTWFSFTGHVERGVVASPLQAGYYLLTGRLTEHTGDAASDAGGDSRVVSLKREAEQP